MRFALRTTLRGAEAALASLHAVPHAASASLPSLVPCITKQVVTFDGYRVRASGVRARGGFTVALRFTRHSPRCGGGSCFASRCTARASSRPCASLCVSSTSASLERLGLPTASSPEGQGRQDEKMHHTRKCSAYLQARLRPSFAFEEIPGHAPAQDPLTWFEVGVDRCGACIRLSRMALLTLYTKLTHLSIEICTNYLHFSISYTPTSKSRLSSPLPSHSPEKRSAPSITSSYGVQNFVCCMASQTKTEILYNLG